MTAAETRAIRARLSRLYDLGADRIDWYYQARAEAFAWADRIGVDRERFLMVVAAVSPKTRWELLDGTRKNLQQAQRVVMLRRANPDVAPGVLASKPNPGMLRNSLDNGLRVLDSGDPADLTKTADADKVPSFYRNLRNPGATRTVTIDSHMARAILGDRKATDRDIKRLLERVGGYDRAADHVRAVAKRKGVAPDAAQAAIWCAWKEGETTMNDVWELVESPPDGCEDVADLYSWSTNFGPEGNPFQVFLDLIGWSDEEMGEPLLAGRDPSSFMGYLEVDKLADALKEYADRPHDVREFVNALMMAEGQ